MKYLVLYDTNFGNTKKIAEIIAKNLNKDAKAVSVSNFDKKNLKNTKLLLVGSPINGWQPSKNMNEFLNNLKIDELKGIKATAFDTRINIFFHGDAMRKISNKLENAGAEIITEPKAFFVRGKEGPITEGEEEQAANWAKYILQILEQ